MAELIATIILVCSLIGMGTIVSRKIQILADLPTKKSQTVSEGLLLRFKERVKSLRSIKTISLEIFLQKFLSKIRILILKAENKTARWLQKLRERTKSAKLKENDNYWKELKKSRKPRANGQK